MARFLSPEWVASFDAALSTLDLSDVVAAAGARSLAAADGTFSVAQVVRGAPGPDGVDQELRVVLTVAGGRAHLELDPEGRVAGTATIVLHLVGSWNSRQRYHLGMYQQPLLFPDQVSTSVKVIH